MKTLFILRHAKSSWSDATLADFDRPLNERGLRAAPFMGELMARAGFVPSMILSSSAIRAKTTAELVKASAGFECEITLDERIYEASPHTLVEVISEIGDDHVSAMIVGHNPGMERFVHYLTGQLEPMPTAALAVIEINVTRWNAISDGCGELKKVYRPKEEMK